MGARTLNQQGSIGAAALRLGAWQLTLATAPPLIAPARSFLFPVAVPGEEEALARGSAWLSARGGGAAFVAQLALGFTGAGVASGLWPVGYESCLAIAGGYAYLLRLADVARTALLPLRPAVAVLPARERLILAGHHRIAVIERDNTCWLSERLSWEGVTLLRVEGDMLHGTGWELSTDTEVPFTVDLSTRETLGGGLRLMKAKRGATQG